MFFINYRAIALAASLLMMAPAFAEQSSASPPLQKIECDKIRSSDKTLMEPPVWNGWGNGHEQARFQAESIGKLSANNLGKLKLLWAYGFSNSNKVDAQPTVIGNRIFSSGGSNAIHAIDLSTGCKIWSTSVSGRVRTTIVASEIEGKLYLFLGDQSGTAYALEAESGKRVWSKRLDSHPYAQITGSPVVFNSVVYFPTSSGLEEGASANSSYLCCTFRGSLSALKATDGSVIWKTYTIQETATKNNMGRMGPSGAGIWSSPTIDPNAGKIYVATGNNFSLPATGTSDAIIAMSLENGSIIWTKQITPKDVTNNSCYESNRTNCPIAGAPDHDFASSVMLVTADQNRKILIAGQKSGVVTALDPEKNGDILWQKKIGNGSPLGGIQYGMASDGKKIFAAISFIQTIRSSSSTNGAQQGVDGWYVLGSRGGGLHALDILSGDIKWSTPHPGCKQVPGCSQAQSAAVTATDGFVLSGGLDGVLRAYSSDDGKIIWEVDTKITVKGNNGVTARGGSLDGPGPVIVPKMILVNSGYQMFGGIPGNALFAFGLSE
jgi:polyvinyl alcohol dehydrogenase (cytochrome)